MSNRQYLIRGGITDAYVQVFGVPWVEAQEHEFPLVEAMIEKVMPSRWDSKNPPLLRSFAMAYAVAEFASDTGQYRRDGLG